VTALADNPMADALWTLGCLMVLKNRTDDRRRPAAEPPNLRLEK
jgi:hypothetical protein